MQLFYLISLFPLAALATLNGHCSGSAATGVWKDNGICIKTSTCNQYHGEYKSGACPNDPDDVKCCVIGYAPNAETNPCGKYSVCDWTANTCSGYRVDDKCPGLSNFKCCHF
ncbi:hypothetical protein BR93DRAFT_201309 [Coniochaeta sp. PMI_546]|nr:hypothetical protein BR93DRAFT_201309 [Coniochaeta sp. PMI_546]